MTTPTAPRIDFLNTTLDEVVKLLRDEGKNVKEAAEFLAEPIPNVMGVWTWLRDTKQVEARNMTPAPAPAAPQRPHAAPVSPTARPVHTPDPDVATRIAGATDVLVKAASIDNKRIQGALARARKAMTDLAGLVADYEGKTATRNRIARLEAELRVARAELTGRSPMAATSGGGSAVAASDSEDDGKTCRKGCGRDDFQSAHSRGQHERHCNGPAATDG